MRKRFRFTMRKKRGIPRPAGDSSASNTVNVAAPGATVGVAKRGRKAGQRIPKASSSSSTVVPKKRGRPVGSLGRKRRHQNTDASSSSSTVVPKKRGRPVGSLGRKRRHLNTDASSVVPQKRGRGRPRIKPEDVSKRVKAVAKRGRKKVQVATVATVATAKSPKKDGRKKTEPQANSGDSSVTKSGQKRDATPNGVRLQTTARIPKKRARIPVDPEEYMLYGDLANDEKEIKVNDRDSQKKAAEAVQKLEAILAQRQEVEDFMTEAARAKAHEDIINKFREMILFKTSGRKFGRLFRQIESKIFKYEKDFVIKCADGEDYNNKLQRHGRERVYIVNKTDETFGLKIPDLNNQNLKEYLGEAAEQDRSFAIAGYEQTHKDVSVTRFLNEIEKRDSGAQKFDLLNLLSFEVSNERLSNDIILPKFVNSHSLIRRILNKLTMLKTGADQDTLKRIESIEKGLPTIEKFLLLTMRGSFTEVHIDSSATGVYYHVIKGKKVIYAAKPTEENIKWYCEAEKRGIREKVWLCAQHLDEFRRFELCPGQTLMLPLGWLHFVFTPEDSIVVGGNFLEEEYLDLSMEMTKVEEDCVKVGLSKSNLLPHFWETLYVFIEFFVNPELRQAVDEGTPISDKCLALAKMLDKQLPRTYVGCSWMSKRQMQKQRQTMFDLINKLESNNNDSSDDEEGDANTLNEPRRPRTAVPSTNKKKRCTGSRGTQPEAVQLAQPAAEATVNVATEASTSSQ